MTPLLTRALGPMSTLARLRRVTLVAAGSLVTAASVGLAQSRPAGPFVPLGSRLDWLIRWTIADGGLEGIDPLTRPFRMAAVRDAAAAAATDSSPRAPARLRILELLNRELSAAADSVVVTAEVGVAAYRNGRRDSFREGGGAGVSPAAGVWLGLSRGPFVAVLNPGFDNRLEDDPEFTGNTDRVITGRLQSGYLAVTGGGGDLLLGRLPQQWGPELFDGLQLSASAYPTDMLSGTLRFGRLSLTTVAQRLDDYDTTLAAPVSRYFFAHRLGVRAGRHTWLAFTETGVYGGPARGFEPAFHVPLNPGLLSEVNEGKRVNLLWGAQIHTRIRPGITVQGELVVDDFQIDDDTLTDSRPWSGGFSLVVRAALPAAPMHVSLGYTQVRSLSYRNAADPWGVYAVRGVGIARNFADYDQVLLRAEAMLGSRADAALDLSFLRQGSGDFRQPFPTDTVLAQPGQGFLVAPARKALGARATLRMEPWKGLSLRGTGGVNGRLGGGMEAILELGVRLAFDVLHGTGGSAWPALERPSR